MVTQTSVEDPKSGCRLDAQVTTAGRDLVIVIAGGEKPHVGCLVLAQPCPSKSGPDEWSASCSVLTLPPHKEEPIARAVAETVCRASGRVTVVTAGVHDDNLDIRGIETYLRLGNELADKLAARLTTSTI